MSVSERDARIVLIRSGNKCSFPDCPQIIAFRGGSETYTITGVLAHIKGEKPTAARYDPSQTEEERNSPDNIILLCQTHHKIIDDQPDIYTVEKLHDIKNMHEALVIRQWSKGVLEISFVELEVIKKYIISNTVSESEIIAIHPKDKIKKNELSPKIENLIRVGLVQESLIRNYIEKNLDPEFGERLRQGFITKYKELKERSKGDELFELLFSFSSGGTSNFNEQVAGLAILSYFFEKCDVFEK